jgi:glycosyltransferase involved in cell wall biosynthesis
MAPTVVLLSAYNGSRYIVQQIDSIRDQSYKDWQLIVRDDGSTDSTRQLVTSIAAGDSRITLLDDQRNVGPWRSFGILLEKAAELNAASVFLCDQDDVWLPDKMAMQLARLASISSRSPGVPVLVHTDLTVVDEELRTINESWHRYQRMSYFAQDPLRTLLIHNAVVGCTIALNRELLSCALPVPDGVYHDWWLALCAAAFGVIEMLEQRTVLYRQHSANVVGAAHRHNFIRRLVSHPIDFVRSSFDEFAIGVDQASELRDRATALRQDGKRVATYSDAFAPAGSVLSRLSSYRKSRAMPQRLVSRVLMYGIVAAYPAMRAGSGSSGLGDN